MCYSKEEFPPYGKTCDVHNLGNKACIEMSSMLAGVSNEKVAKVFNSLRKEGKGLPDPTPEEVEEYTASQVFTAKYDPKIENKSRNKIVNWWRKARDTQPSGGLMHAWKNTLPQTLARYRRTAFASVAMFSIALTSACGSTPPRENTENTSSPVATTAPASPSEEASVKPVESATPTPTFDNSIAGRTISKLEGQGVKMGDTVKVKGGSYPEYNITKESHLAKFDKSLYTGKLPKGWSQKDVEKGQVVSANYLTNYLIDNPQLNDYEANKSTFQKKISTAVASKYKQDFINSVNTRDTSPFNKDIFTNNFAGDTTKGFRFVSDGKTPRIADLSQMKMTKANEWDGGGYYEYEGIVTMNVVDKSNKPYTMDQSIFYGITVVKENGKFLMLGVDAKDSQYTNPEPTS